MPFETTTLTLEPDSLVALYTKGLMLCGGCDIDADLRRLTDGLVAHCRPGGPLEEASRAVLAGIDAQPARDDVPLLVARTRVVREENTAGWQFPADPSVVAEAREKTTRQLSAWELDELAFTTELVVRELVTNAVRYAGGPVGLRLIREDGLICEVADPRNTSRGCGGPAVPTREAAVCSWWPQFSTRWGCRYGRTGKTIWAQQSLTAPTA